MVDQKSERSISLVRLSGACSMLNYRSVRLTGSLENGQGISRVAPSIEFDGTASVYVDLRAESEVTLGRDSMQVRGQVSMQPR